MDSKTEETMLKIADYNNIEREFFSKRMCMMFAAAILRLIVFAVDIAGLERTQPYATIVSVLWGIRAAHCGQDFYTPAVTLQN